MAEREPGALASLLEARGGHCFMPLTRQLCPWKLAVMMCLPGDRKLKHLWIPGVGKDAKLREPLTSAGSSGNGDMGWCGLAQPEDACPGSSEPTARNRLQAQCSPVPGDECQGVRAAWPEPQCPPREIRLSRVWRIHAMKQRKHTVTAKQEEPPSLHACTYAQTEPHDAAWITPKCSCGVGGGGGSPRHKKLHTVGFHLCNIKTQTKLSYVVRAA